MIVADKDRTKPKLLITGAGGLLGHALCAAARPNWSVLALYRRHRPQLEGIGLARLDLTDAAKVSALLHRFRPQALIHAAAASNVADCERNSESSASINVAASAHLAELCAGMKIDMLFTSTDLVFDGQKAPYDETAAPAPICVYGAQKAQAEEKILDRHPRALVCRLPLLFGLTPYTGSSFAVQMICAIADRRPIHLLEDEYRTPVDTHSAAKGLLQMLGRASGRLHLGGRTRLSRYCLGLMMAECMDVAPDMIRPVRITEMNFSYPRAPDCTLDSRRADTLGYDPLPLKCAVRRMVDRFRKQSAGGIF